MHASEKCRSGIEGLDDILGGGLPRGRATLIVGGPGTGKTVLAMEFAARGVERYGEPAAFFSGPSGFPMGST